MAEFSIIQEKPKLVDLKDGKIFFGQVEEITSRDVGARQASLARIILFGPDFIHRHKNAEETYICEEGKGKIILGDEIFDFSIGTRVVIPPGTPHAVKPADPFPRVMFLCLSSPPFSPEDSYPDPRGRNW